MLSQKIFELLRELLRHQKLHGFVSAGLGLSSLSPEGSAGGLNILLTCGYCCFFLLQLQSLKNHHYLQLVDSVLPAISNTLLLDRS